jgi:hypothetical protein
MPDEHFNLMYIHKPGRGRILYIAMAEHFIPSLLHMKRMCIILYVVNNMQRTVQRCLKMPFSNENAINCFFDINLFFWTV